jgi:hypothetical protein
MFNVRAEGVEEAGAQGGGGVIVYFEHRGERQRSEVTYEDEHEKVHKEELKIRGGEHIKVRCEKSRS